MAAYRRVYDSRHLQADCQEPGSAREPGAEQSSMDYLYLIKIFQIQVVTFAFTLSAFESVRVGDRGPQRTGVLQLGLRGNISVPFLAFRRLDVGRGRRPAADDQRPPGLLPLAVAQRVLVRAAREGIRQVRLTSVVSCTHTHTHTHTRLTARPGLPG